MASLGAAAIRAIEGGQQGSETACPQKGTRTFGKKGHSYLCSQESLGESGCDPGFVLKTMVAFRQDCDCPVLPVSPNWNGL